MLYSRFDQLQLLHSPSEVPLLLSLERTVAMRLRRIAFVLVCSGGSLLPSTAFSQEYVTQPLATPPGYTDCIAMQSNDNGEVVGTCDHRAVVWRNGRPDVLRLPQGFIESSGAGLNASGTVVGTCVSPDLRTACVWEHGVVRLLPIPSDATGSTAVAVNSLGYVAGTLHHPRCEGILPAPQAVVWSPSDTVRVLVLGPSGLGSCPQASESRDINDNGDVAVDVSVASSYGAAVWTESGYLLGLPPGIPSRTHAADINNDGDVVGYTEGVLRALLWRGGVVTVLQPPVGAVEASASGINDKAEVCGIALDLSTGIRPTVWRDGVGEFLNSPEEDLGLTNRISNAGIVAGSLGNVAALFVPQVTVHAAQAIADSIDVLVAHGQLRPTDATSLQALIGAVIGQLAAGNTVAAKNLLGALENNVAALQKTGRLAPQDAVALTNAIDDLIARLGN